MKLDPHQFKGSKGNSAFKFETKKGEVDFIFLKRKANSRSEVNSIGLQKCLERPHKEIILENM